MSNTAERLDDEFESAGHEADDRRVEHLGAPETDEELEVDSLVAERDDDDFYDEEEQVAAAPVARSKKEKTGGGKVLGASALLIALAAVGMGGKSYMDTSQLRTDVNAAYDAMNEQIQALGMSANDLNLALAQLDGRVIENAAAISGIDTGTIQSRVNNLQLELNNFQRLVGQNQTATDAELAAIAEETRALEALLKEQQAAYAKIGQSQGGSTPQAKVAAPKKAAAAPKPKTLSSIEGAELISIDQWGYDANIVMRDTQTGLFIAKAVGDSFRGWRITQISSGDGVAKFTSGGKTITVKQLNS